MYSRILRQGRTVMKNHLDLLYRRCVTFLCHVYEQIQNFINMLLRMCLRAPGMLIGALIMAIILSPSLSIIFAVVIFMLVAGQDTSFVIMYANIIFMMFGLSTISYDAFDNGEAFLFTLPITKKLYVKEKYVFSLASLLFGFLF